MKFCLQKIKNCDYEVTSYSLQSNQSSDLSAKQPTPELQLSSYQESIRIMKLTTDAHLEGGQNFQLKKQKARVNLMQQFKEAASNSQVKSSQSLKRATVWPDDSDSLYFSALDIGSSSPNKICSTILMDKSCGQLNFRADDLSESQIDFEEDHTYPAFSNETYYSPIVQTGPSKASKLSDYLSLNGQSNDTYSMKSSSFFQSTQNANDFVDENDHLYVCRVACKAKCQ